MNFIFDEISEKLSDGCEEGYRKGLERVVSINKKTILRLMEDLPDGKAGGRWKMEFQDKAPLFTISYTATDQLLINNFIAEAFAVAGVMNYEAEEKLKALAKSIIDGSHPLLQAHPESVDIKLLWQTEAYNIIGQYVDVEDMPDPTQLNTNLRTAVMSSYHAAQYQRLQEVKDVYPAYRYKTQADGRVRDEHAVLHNKVFMANDPIWDTIWPPNGWNCRCYIEPISYDELPGVNSEDRLSLEDGGMREGLLNDANISEDFQRNPGQQASIWGRWLKMKLKDMPNEVIEDIKRRIAGTSS